MHKVETSCWGWKLVEDLNADSRYKLNSRFYKELKPNVQPGWNNNKLNEWEKQETKVTVSRSGNRANWVMSTKEIAAAMTDWQWTGECWAEDQTGEPRTKQEGRGPNRGAEDQTEEPRTKQEGRGPNRRSRGPNRRAKDQTEEPGTKQKNRDTGFNNHETLKSKKVFISY